MILFHGDNTVASRKKLIGQITQAKQKGVKDIIWLDGKKITQTDLIQALETTSLFGTNKLIILENLFARQQSTIKKNLISYLKTFTNHPNSPDIILWESKFLTKTQLQSLANPKQLSFKIPKTLFKFLSSLGSNSHSTTLNLLHQSLNQEQTELVFALIIRQIRLLIQAQDQTPLKLAHWQLNQLKTQASHISKTSLLKLHKKLLTLDQEIKTGKNLLDLPQALDILIATL